jgi:Icc-related predicted phosphoesterase
VKIYGSPWQPWFGNWAFNLPRHDKGRETARHIWSQIPDGADVLIFHGPPHTILDETIEGEKVGCPMLYRRIFSLDHKPKLVVFGHIHESYGTFGTTNMLFANVSLCTRQYAPTNPIKVFNI